MVNRKSGCLGNPLVPFCEGLGGNSEIGSYLAHSTFSCFANFFDFHYLIEVSLPGIFSK